VKQFPTTPLAAVRYSEDEAVGRDFLAGLRWPVAVACVFCGSEKVGHIATRSLWRCKGCRKQFSVRKGTIFEDSPIPLSKWLPAICLYSAGKKGRSSHQLARDLGVTQKTAWFMSHRIRLAMETDTFNSPLSGEVEVDETLARLQRKHGASAASTPPPSPPDAPSFKAFVIRLLRVPKAEIEAREAARERRPPHKPSQDEQ